MPSGFATLASRASLDELTIAAIQCRLTPMVLHTLCSGNAKHSSHLNRRSAVAQTQSVSLRGTQTLVCIAPSPLYRNRRTD